MHPCLPMFIHVQPHILCFNVMILYMINVLCPYVMQLCFSTTQLLHMNCWSIRYIMVLFQLGGTYDSMLYLHFKFVV
jgi:hypothetical protein